MKFNQARHKVFDISPAVLASVQTPSVSARNWLGLMATAQHTTAGQSHSEHPDYTAFNGTYVRQFFGSSKDGGLTAMSDEFTQMFDKFSASKTGGWCLGIKLSDDNASRLGEATLAYDGVERIRLTAEQPYLVQLNGLRPRAFLSFKEVADWLAKRMDKAPALASLKRMNADVLSDTFGTSTQYITGAASPVNADALSDTFGTSTQYITGAASPVNADALSDTFGTSTQYITGAASPVNADALSDTFGTSTQYITGAAGPVLSVKGVELLPERTRNGHLKRGNELSIIKLEPFMHINGEPIFQSPYLMFSSYRSVKVPSDNVRYPAEQPVEITAMFDVDYLKRERQNVVRHFNDVLPPVKASSYIECYDYHVRLLAENDGKWSWTYWRHMYGRLNLLGSDFNLQILPRLVRKSLTSCPNMSSYDLSSCHPRLFVAICRHYGVRLPHCEQLIRNKHGVRRHVAHMLNITEDEAKPIITSFVFGKGFSKDIKSGRIKLVNEPDYYSDNVIYGDIEHTNDILSSISTELSNWLIDFAVELKNARHLIIQWWNEVVNVDGSCPMPSHITGYYGNTHQKAMQQVSFVLTQIEASFVTSILQREHQVVAIIHDGLTVTNRDISPEELKSIEMEIDRQWSLTDAILIEKE
ncbi:hypothetical protein [Ferrimonas lipolytica]|uniref:Uncharacterized protein n=1 Tax=Ferrimonas lipolytica TaxID=2724191 RepID=A0A6H1UG38_9GAMM|nr:hypothetical protein [Ferrimonas lipolytica]QIZ78067.1 hypothetical protein HER31_14875 [Ferrimonas lipolytica]